MNRLIICTSRDFSTNFVLVASFVKLAKGVYLVTGTADTWPARPGSVRREAKPRTMRLFVIILVLVFPPNSSWAEVKPPLNVLWLCSDDHVPYVMGAYGNEQVRTPNLDRLAAQGMRFDAAFCNSPVCTASRQSF